MFDLWIYQGHIKNAANFENYEENFKLFNHDAVGTKNVKCFFLHFPHFSQYGYSNFVKSAM